ncbi:hypothetical protein SAMN05216522_104226 [Rosenbergiella nectarea]|uniref:Uncharacterized protein n=1 Tax=Rosenbergiella nectarea TaxID=988801 RepID=A0A1H9HH16_9GAMM|nr:hypothetical protein SAMN05216522_104226 [Rosenbergiella nectarea]
MNQIIKFSGFLTLLISYFLQKVEDYKQIYSHE